MHAICRLFLFHLMTHWLVSVLIVLEVDHLLTSECLAIKYQKKMTSKSTLHTCNSVVICFWPSIKNKWDLCNDEINRVLIPTMEMGFRHFVHSCLAMVICFLNQLSVSCIFLFEVYITWLFNVLCTSSTRVGYVTICLGFEPLTCKLVVKNGRVWHLDTYIVLICSILEVDSR